MKAVLEFNMLDSADKDSFVHCYKGEVYAEAIRLFGEWLSNEMRYHEERYSEEQYATLKLVSDKFFSEVEQSLDKP